MADRDRVRILVATQSQEVYRVLGDQDNIQYDIALYTGSIRDLLPEVQLVIIDYEDVVEYPLSEGDVREAIYGANILKTTSTDFLAGPERFLTHLIEDKPGHMRDLPDSFSLAFVSCSGGTGRTTLALDTAYCYADHLKHDRERMRRNGQASVGRADTSATLVELAFGSSAFESLVGVDMPSLYQLVTDSDAQSYNHRGVAFMPMDYENVRVLSDQLLERYLHRQVERPGLTIIEGVWPHSFSRVLRDCVDLWLVVAMAHRPDTVANAQRLYDTLCQEMGSDKVWLLKNQAAHGKSEEGINWHIQIPRIARPDEFRGELGEIILSRIMSPAWQDSQKSHRTGLFG